MTQRVRFAIGRAASWWPVILLGMGVTLGSGAVCRCELDGAPVSHLGYGFPLPWVHRTGPTQFSPAHPVDWWFSLTFLGIDVALWSWAVAGLLRWRSRRRAGFHEP